MISSLKRLSSIFRNPGSYFANPEASILDGVLVILALFLVTFLQKLVWVEPSMHALSTFTALEQAVVNSLLVWALYCVFFFALAGIFRKNQNPVKLCGLVGVAGLPVVITTLISGLSWLAASLFDLTPILSQWLFWQNGLSWLGLAFAWPGVFGYFLLYDDLKFSRFWSIFFVAAAFALLIIGKLVS